MFIIYFFAAKIYWLNFIKFDQSYYISYYMLYMIIPDRYINIYQ